MRGIEALAGSIFVNLHTHTAFSDGAPTPEALAQSLAGAGVRYAALTDHDSVDGLARFAQALEPHGIPSLSGIELTTHFDGRLVHLVAYGFDPHHPELRSTLASMHPARDADVHTIAGSLRRAGSRRPAGSGSAVAASNAADGRLDVGDAIALIHRAGGRAFLAHPLHLESDAERLESEVVRLKAMGLDGIEAIYAEFTPEEQAGLRRLAHKHDLLVCAGTDYHGIAGLGSSELGIDMPTDDWARFREAMFSGPGFVVASPRADQAVVAASATESVAVRRRSGTRSFALRVALPAVTALVLILIALWGLILPSFEQTLVERKREMIKELTNSAWSVLATYQQDEEAGLLTREEAQAAAASVIRDLRYGPDGLDYFWIQNTQPTMVMHPYRADLDGEDLSGFTDSRGVPIFVEFSDLVQAEGQGYVDYVWQWFDDPERLEPKESYVKGFEPWGWVIGTGVYTDDVRAEIDRIARNLVLTALGISGAIALLLLFVLQQSLRIERRREDVVTRLRDSTQRYHALVEATTEGTLLIVDGRCRYANRTLLDLLDYTSRQLEFLEVHDVLPRGETNEALWQILASGAAESPLLGVAREGSLTRSDGDVVECVLTLNPVVFGDQAGCILLVRDVAGLSAAARSDTLAHGAPAGVFRALASRHGVFMEISPVGREMLAQSCGVTDEQASLADCFTDPAEYGRVLRRILDEGEIRDYILTFDDPLGERSILLSAALVRDEQGEPAYIDGVLVDVTAVRAGAVGREGLVEQLQASLLFLHGPVADLAKAALVVNVDTSIGQVAQQMTQAEATAALVSSASGAIIGVVTDRDVCARAVAEERTADEPVHAVMSAPLIRISQGASVYEALMRMDEHEASHLAIEAPDGAVTGVIDRDALVRSPQYTPLVVLREIARAESATEVAEQAERRLSLSAGLIGCSARPRPVTSMLSSIFDAATVRLIELAIDELGPAPVEYAFIVVGSQGRREVHLTSDQDNGIVYAATGDADADEVAVYFLRLGARVCEGLDAAGYPLCRGKVMASDPKWCRSLPDWLSTYDAWLRKAEPQDITDLSIFLDFRLVHGDAGLVHQLRRHIHATLPDQRGVQYQLARNALMFRPPIRLPGNIYLGGASEHSGHIDLKDALQPLVAFARVEAARHRIDQTHTLGRIAELADRGHLSASSRDEITDAYDFLMQLRLETQLADVRAGEPPASSVELSKLSHTQRELLRIAFTRIAAIQKTAENEFPEPG